MNGSTALCYQSSASLLTKNNTNCLDEALHAAHYWQQLTMFTTWYGIINCDVYLHTKKKDGSGPKHVYWTRNFRRNVTNIGLSEVSQGYFNKSTCTSSALQRIRLLSPPTFRTFDPCTNHRYHGTSTLPLLHHRYSLSYPQIADGAIPTSYTRPTWTPYIWRKHLEKIARTMLNDTKCKRMWIHVNYHHSYLNNSHALQ